MNKQETTNQSNISTVASVVANAAVVATDINWIKKSLVGIEDTLKTMQGIYATNVALVESNKQIIDHETRLRSMESSMWKFVGAFSVISATIGVLGGRVAELIFR